MVVKNRFFKIIKSWRKFIYNHYTNFINIEISNLAFKLKDTLHSLKWTPRKWYEYLNKFLLDNSFKIRNIDNILFIATKDDIIFIVKIYIDDIIYSTTNICLSNIFKMHAYWILNEYDRGTQLVFF